MTPREPHITRYRRFLRDTRGLPFADYDALWRWSVTELEAFWQSIWDYFGLRSPTPHECVLRERRMPGAVWFPGAQLNYAQHLFGHADASHAAGHPAIVFADEALLARGALREVSWPELRRQVVAFAAALRGMGVQRGDRVCAVLPNVPETIVAFLGCASVGAIWSVCSPDMGPLAVLDRFRQIEPVVLIGGDGYRYAGAAHDRRELLSQLLAELPTVRHAVLWRCLGLDAELAAPGRAQHDLAALLQGDAPFAPEWLPFDHPLWIVYSSGTTGLPKPIVHGHGGTTLEYLKAFTLHCDLGPDDRFFWQTSPNWIMWNMLVSVPLTGATALMYDGNPGHPDLGTLWRFAARERATFFGLSPAFVQLNRKAGVEPGRDHDLSSLRTVGATGSPLTDDACRWIYAHVHPDVLLASISGGTDPNTAFLGTCPTAPVYAGEMQARGLGAAVYAYDEAGRAVYGAVGELVCTQPMPSMPLYFWGDTDGRRYRDSYFDTYPGAWRHGDWLELRRRPETVTGIIYGRSDATINRHGIRMGTSELYRVVEAFDEVADSLVIDLEYLGRDSWMALFVVPRVPGTVDDALRVRLRQAIRTQLSARHVPDEVVEIAEVPRTISGKKLEVPVKKILLGHDPARACNRSAMANPASIDWFVAFAAQRTARAAG
jgi:acetoacetyl-CoA synthetase